VTGADESYSEGVVDHLRAVEGTAVAGLVRELLSDGAATQRKVSLRATDDRVDVSAIARALGGGGHRRAAGFSTDLEFPELVTFLRSQLARQL
jgi:bifunctional oligoribonuclease and PAP phosphatase NrnA